jgi:hypothetical protein
LQRALQRHEEVAHVQEAWESGSEGGGVAAWIARFDSHEGRRKGKLTVGLRTVVSAAFSVFGAAVRVHKVRLSELARQHVRRGEGWALGRRTRVAAAGVVAGGHARRVEVSIGGCSCFCVRLEWDLVPGVVGSRGIERMDHGKNGRG